MFILSNKYIDIHFYNNKNVEHNYYAIILVILWPFIGLIHTLYNWRQRWAKNTFWLVCVYMGAVHVYWPEGTFLGIGADGGRYVLRLMEWYNLGYSLKTLFGNYLVDPHTMDLYQQLVTWGVSKVTENGHVLFMIFAIVYGFFYSRNMWYILEKLPENIPVQFIILITLFFLISPITHINGVRMWTALHVYVYAFMPYLFEKDKKYLWMLLLTPLIHFSYLYVMLVGYAFVLIPYSLKAESKLFLWCTLVFFIITLFINSLNLNTVSDVLVEYSPDAYSNRIEGYVSQSVLERNVESSALRNWYIAASSQIKYWSYNLLLFALFPYLKKYYKQKDVVIHWYNYTMILGGLANIMSLIPSGGRFQLLSQMFSVSLILMLTSSFKHDLLIYKIFNIVLLILLIPFIVDIRTLFDYYSISLIFGNFITVFFWENNTLLITYIKMLV